MQLKMQTDYAIRILLYLSDNGGTVNMQEMSDNLGIKKTYIPRTLRMLRESGMVTSESGTNGGFQLIKPPAAITLLDVMELSEDTVKVNRCLEKDHFCSRNAVGRCAVHDVYNDFQEMAEWYFGSITLADLLEQNASVKIRARHAQDLARFIGAPHETTGGNEAAGRDWHE